MQIKIVGFNDKQFEIASQIINTPPEEVKYWVIRAGRQSGKSFLLHHIAPYFALTKPNLNIGYFNAYHTQNQKPFLEITRLAADVIKQRSNGTPAKITFINGSTIWFMSAKNFNSTVGPSFDYLLCDEFALWPKDAWSYVQPTVNAKPKAKVLIASTPRGKNQFWNIVQDCKKYSWFKEITMSYKDNNLYDLREVERVKQQGDFVYRQEILAEFVFGSGTVFKNFGANQILNEWKESDPNERYFFGTDIAGSGQDSTSLTIGDSKGNIVFMFEPESDNTLKQADECAFHIKRFKATGYSETNGLGLGFTERLEENSCNVTRFVMTNSAKQELVANALEQLTKGVELPSIELYPKLDNEMSTYVVDRTKTGLLTYSHDKGLHDDTVDSWMLMLKKQKEETTFGNGGFVDIDFDQFGVNPYIYSR